MKKRRLAACDECKTRFYVRSWDYSKRSKVRCPGCGCSRFDLVANDAMSERGDLNAEAVKRKSARDSA